MIITNFNYGHFLKACLASVAAQVRPADEVIIVDDGSTDGSTDELAGTTGVRVISQQNRGQSAAFNAGFAVSSGDILLFLDADDVLAPEALHVVERCWSDEIAGLSYDLATIDIDGHASGHYQMRGGSGSQRYRVLREIAVNFMPTSGNAFARAAVAWAFPLPEENWRISADALLVRAVLLGGTMQHLPQTLGGYRLHGHNNYFADGVTPTWQIRRGSADIARAGLDLVAMIDRAGVAAEFARMRPLLLFAALRRRMVSDCNGDDLRTMRAFLSRLFWLQARRGGIGFLTLFALARLFLPRSPQLRAWAIDRAARPLWLQTLIRVLQGRRHLRASADLLTGPTCYQVSETPWCASGSALHRLCAGPEWHWQFDLPVALCDADGAFTLRRLMSEPVYLDVDLEPPPWVAAVSVEIWRGSDLLERFLVSERQVCRVILPEAGGIAAAQEEFLIRVRRQRARLWPRLRRAGQACVRLYLHSVAVNAAPRLSTGAVLPVADTVPIGLVPVVAPVTQPGASLGDPAGAHRPGHRLLSVAPPAFQGPACLSLALAETQLHGWADVWQQDELVFSGEVGPASTCLLPLRRPAPHEVGEIILDLQFRANDPLSDGNLDVQSLGWVCGAFASEGRRILSFGSHVSAATPDGFSQALGAGWVTPDDGCPVMFGLSAGLGLALAPFASGTNPVLVLDLEPLSPTVAPFHLVVAVTINGHQATQRNLTGNDRVEIPLRDFLDRTVNALDVEIFAGARRVNAETADLESYGGLRLRGLGLQPAGPILPPVSRPSAGHGDSDVRLRHLLFHLDDTSKIWGDGDALLLARADIIGELDRLSPTALQNILSPHALLSLAKLGARLPVIGATVDWPATNASHPAAEWLRTFARQIVSGPASLNLRQLRIRDLPACSAEYARAIGACMAQDAGADLTPEQFEEHRLWLCRVLEQARSAIASCEATDHRRQIAVAFLENCRLNQLIFANDPISDFVSAFARTLETFLLCRGDMLHLSARERADGPVRVGILVRHTEDAPETRILRALLAMLPQGTFAVTVFAVEQAVPEGDFPGAPPMIGLAGLPVSMAVATIRACCPDIMLMGGFFFGFDRMTLIAAHKLAMRQVALSAISPTTTGLSSVDTFVLGDVVAPLGCEADYTETCVRAPGTAQVFQEPAAPAEPVGNRALLRLRLGIGDDAVMLTSGAMMDKIGVPLLRAWMAILARSPTAVLVLYPFAPNWNRQFDQGALIDRLDRMRAEFGLSADRVRCLAPVTRAEVRQVLQAADIYLDSFPYAGATTTVEALSEGLPVVALSGSTQRGHRAAGWLSAFDLNELTAADVPAYVDLAVAMACDPVRRGQVSDRIARNRAAAVRQQEFSDWFVNFLSPAAPAAPRYIFHHLPKSGGISVRKMFESWFTVVRDYREPWGPVDPAPLDLNTLGPDHLLTGHYATDGVPLAARYPETADPARWRRISFLRDPLELALSYYFFERVTRGQHDPTFCAKPLGQFLRDYPGLYLAHFECTRDNWQETLESYWFLGTLERLPDCMGWLAKTLGKPPPEVIRHDHATPRTEAPEPEDVAVFARNMALEFEIYRWVSHRLCLFLGEPPLDRL